MPAVEEHLTDDQTREISMKLLQTIKIPRGNMRLARQNLPKSQYVEEQEIEEDEKETDDEFSKAQKAPRQMAQPQLPPRPAQSIAQSS